MGLHILPINDLKEHEELTTCECCPSVEFENSEMIIIHNSFDGREINENKMETIKNEREKGYYWCYGVAWHDVKHWAIYQWDGHVFWNGDEDLGEESIEEIDGNQILKVDFEIQNKIINRAIHFIETNTIAEPKSKRISASIVSELKTLNNNK